MIAPGAFHFVAFGPEAPYTGPHMKRIIGAILMLGGAACLYCFAASGAFLGREISAPATGLPFLSLGKGYPLDAVLLLGAFWGFLIGLALVVGAQGGAPKPVAATPGSAAARYAATAGRRGGTIARFMLLNGLLLLSTLFVAYIGGMSRHPDVSVVGVFGLVALIQMGLGVVLMILALFEQPKGVLSIILGIPLHLFGIIIGLLAFFLWGRA